MGDKEFFRPFVGSSYADGGMFGKRIMILGESHYCDEGCADCGDALRHRECTAFTADVVRRYLSDSAGQQGWMRTFLKFERSLVGQDTDPALRQRIWQSVVFFNYLQVAMGGPREAGTARQYCEAGDTLFRVMEKYQPEYLIAWGKRLWDKMPGERWTDGRDVVADGCHVPTGHYTLASGRVVRAIAVNHPSVGYSWDHWHKVISGFLK